MIAAADEKLRQCNSYPSLPFSEALLDARVAGFKRQPDKVTGCLVILLNVTVGLCLRVFLDGTAT